MGTADPLVSVVVPTYDRPEKLGAAVESVAAQTYRNLELVVVDDASPTPAEPVVAQHADDLEWRCVRHDENRGANAARNTGIRASSGEILSFLDDDDYWLPEKTAAQVASLADDDAGVALATQKTVRDGRVTNVRTPAVEGDATADLLRGKAGAMFSAVAVRRWAVEAAGLPDESLPSWQDREWLVRLSRHCRFVRDERPLVVRRSGDYEQIEDAYETKRDVSYPRFVEKHRDLAAALGCEREFVASLTDILASTALRNGYPRDARRLALRAVRVDPTHAPAWGHLALALTGRRAFDALVRCKRTVERFSQTLQGDAT